MVGGGGLVLKAREVKRFCVKTDDDFWGAMQDLVL